MTIAPTVDLGLIRSVMTHPAVWPCIGDDYSPARDSWAPAINPGIWYLTAHHGDKLLGLFVFASHSPVLWEVHACLLPAARKLSPWAAEAAFEWVFENTDCRRIIATIPGHNRRARALAPRVGMEFVGTNRAAFLKGGTLQDLHIYGLSKG